MHGPETRVKFSSNGEVMTKDKLKKKKKNKRKTEIRRTRDTPYGKRLNKFPRANSRW